MLDLGKLAQALGSVSKTADWPEAKMRRVRPAYEILPRTEHK